MDDLRKPSDVDSPASTFHSSQLGSDYQSDYHSQLAPEYYSVEISNIEMTQLPKVGWISLDDHFWLQIVVDDKMEETSIEGRGSLRWQHKFTFNVRKSSMLSFRLYARRYVHENKFIGKVEKRIETLVTHPDDHIVFKGWYNPEHTDDLEHTSLICRMANRKLSPEEAAMEAAKTELRISNIIVRHLPRIGLTSLDNRFFVQIEVDDKITSVTKVQRGHSLQWNNEYRCDYQKDSRIQLKVLAHRHVHSDQFVGAISDKVESLLQRGFIRQQISIVPIGNEHQLPVSMEFQIASHSSQPVDVKPNALDGGGLTHAMAPTLIVVEVSDICLTRLPKIGMVAFNDHFFVQLVVGDIMETQTTSSKTQQDGSIFWDQKYVFNVPETALLSLQVCARRHIHSDEYIGMVSGPIGVFLQDSGCNDGQLAVFDKQSKRNQETKLSFRMTRSSSCSGNEYCGGSVHSPSTQSRDCSPQQHVDDAVRAVVAMVSPTPKGGMQGDIEPLSVQAAQVFVRDTSDTFQLLLSRITIFVKIARAFAEAHPYTKMALMVLTAGHEVIQRQLARDDRIKQLAFVMCESYGLVSDTPDLHDFHSQAETINLLARQTIECAYFIHDYAVHKSGLKHAVANVFSNIDTTIQDYETAFRKIRTALEQQAVINTQLVVFRIHDVLKDLAAKENLKALPYTTGAAYHAQGSCVMPLEENVNEVSRWVNDKNSPAIYLLIGPDGSENSAVAHAVARQFDNISRLGSSYCFGRTCQRRTANLFSTIARDLADHDPEFMAGLGNKVKRLSIGSSPHIPTQFDFILAPAQQLTSFGPVLVVIDALDACVDSLAEVVSVLKEKARFLPSSFKFLITCLPETDVAITLRDQPHVLSKELDAVDTGQSHDNGFIAGRTKPRPLTPPIQTALSQSDYFSPSGSAVSVASSSSVSSLAPSIFDEGLRTFSPDASSPASSVTSCTDVGPPKRFVSTFKHTETKENCILFDQSGVPQTVTHTITKQTVKQHVSSTPRRVPSYAPMLDMPNAPLFTSDPTTLAGDAFGAVPAQCDSPRPPRHKRTPNRQETIIRHEMQTTGPQPIPLLSL